MQRKIQLVAIDIDGTLVGPDQIVPADVVDAVERVSQAGVEVCLATGRTLVEALPVWRQLRLAGRINPLVALSGALVCEPHTGRTLYQKSIQAEWVPSLERALREAGRTVLGVVDPWRCGYDYLAIPGDDWDDVCRRWLKPQHDVRVREVSSLQETDADLLRVNAILGVDESDTLEATLTGSVSPELRMHEILAMNYGVRVFEAFAPNGDKWTAVRYIAQAYEFGAGVIAAIGDDVNDVSMLRGAGLGVAMPEATAIAKEAADRVAEEGLAAFLQSLVVA